MKVLWQHPTTRLGISNFERKLIKIFWKFFWKNLKKRYLENYKDLSSHIWRQDSQSLKVLWQDPTTGLGISDFAKNKYKLSEKVLKNHKKHHISKTTRNWAVIFGGKKSVKVLWQHPTTRLGISNFERKLIKIFWNFLKKSQKTSYLENYKDLSSHIWRQDSQSLKVFWQDLTTGLGISDFAENKYKLSEKVLKNHKKHHISKTTRNWAVIFGGKIRHLWKYSDSTQLQGWEFQILKEN